VTTVTVGQQLNSARIMLMRANTVGPLYAASVAKTPASVAKT
jgi:hypothetical protein